MNTKHILSFAPISARFVLSACLLLPGLACSDDGGDEEDSAGETEGSDALEIVGSYTDEYGDTHTITEQSWENSGGSFAIAMYDNADMWLVAQNAESNGFNPGLWSRFDWAMDGGNLYYCQSAFDAATMEDAAAASADANDLMMGCGGFAWTNLTP